MKNTVILISGKQGSGKSQTSSALVAKLRTAGVNTIQLKFADVIYKMHDAIQSIAASYGIPTLKKDGLLLQILGTEWGRNTKGENVWADATRNRILQIIETTSKNTCFIIDDCRFVNEFRSFDQMEEDGLLNVFRIRLEAPEEERRLRTDSWRPATHHISETGLDEYAASGLFDMQFETGKNGLSTNYIVETIIDRICE